MKPLSWLMPLVFFSLLFAFSYSERDSFAQNRGGRHNPQPKISDLDAKAKEEYQKIFESVFTQCGDSYYAEHTHIGRTKRVSPITGEGPRETKTVEIFRLKDVSFKVFNNPLDEVSRLNGFQWRGAVTTSYVAAKTYEQNKGWSDWKSRLYLSSYYSLSCCQLEGEKKNSSWQFRGTFGHEQFKGTFDYEADNNDFFMSTKLSKINCSSIPK